MLITLRRNEVCVMERDELLKVLAMLEKSFNQLKDSGVADENTMKELDRLSESIQLLSREVLENREEFITVREGYKHLLSDFQRVQREIEELQSKEEKMSDRRYQASEKVVMLILGAIVSYIASLLTK